LMNLYPPCALQTPQLLLKFADSVSAVKQLASRASMLDI
jgi:hypothetical protein